MLLSTFGVMNLIQVFDAKRCKGSLRCKACQRICLAPWDCSLKFLERLCGSKGAFKNVCGSLGSRLVASSLN